MIGRASIAVIPFICGLLVDFTASFFGEFFLSFFFIELSTGRRLHCYLLSERLPLGCTSILCWHCLRCDGHPADPPVGHAGREEQEMFQDNCERSQWHDRPQHFHTGFPCGWHDVRISQRLSGRFRY